MEEKKNEIATQVNVHTTQDKMVPKFCTTINVGLLESKNVVLTMAYSEGVDNVALIDRIVIDLEHAKRLRDVLNNFLEEPKNV